MIRRLIADLQIYVVDHFCYRILHGISKLRICCDDFAAHRSRGCFKKFQKVMSRNVTPRSNMQRQLGIIASSHHELAEAAIRNAGTSILGNGMDNDSFTALDEYFGDYFTDGSTLRDGVKMTLALGTCVGNKIGLAKCRRQAENRSRHGDSVIEGKCPNQRRWRIWVSCEMPRELNPGFQLNHGNKGCEHSTG